MIFVTGDTHARWIDRLNKWSFPEQKDLTKKDLVIVLGDFGIWDNSKEEAKNLDWLEEKPFTTLFITGNHDNYDLLNAMPIETWNGGNVNFIRPSVIHLCRGQVFNIEGKRFFTFGGASSHDIRDGILEPNDKKTIKQWYKDDKMFRINHVSWWKEELPTEEEMQTGFDNLTKYNCEVNYILTHCPPTSILKQMDCGYGIYKSDILSDYLQKIKEQTQYDKWLFGHMHENTNFNHEKAVCLYEQIVRIL